MRGPPKDSNLVIQTRDFVVVSEAYSERYKKAMHSVMFAKAVKRYRARSREETPSAPQASHTLFQDNRHRNVDQDDRAPHRAPGPSSEESGSGVIPPSGNDDPTRELRQSGGAESAVAELERLPHEVLQHAHAFHSHIRYFMGHNRHPQSQLTPAHNSSKPQSSGDEHSSSRDVGVEEHGLEEDGVPNTIKKLLDDIAGGAENLGQRMKEEILQDDDARKV